MFVARDVGHGIRPPDQRVPAYDTRGQRRRTGRQSRDSFNGSSSDMSRAVHLEARRCQHVSDVDLVLLTVGRKPSTRDQEERKGR